MSDASLSATSGLSFASSSDVEPGFEALLHAFAVGAREMLVGIEPDARLERRVAALEPAISAPAHTILPFGLSAIAASGAAASASARLRKLARQHVGGGVPRRPAMDALARASGVKRKPSSRPT